MQEEGERVAGVEALAGGLRMLLEDFRDGDGVQAHQPRAFRLRHAHRAARRLPAVRHADADRLVGEDLQRHGGVGDGLGAAEDVGALEVRVVARTAAEELVHPAGEHRQLLHQFVREPGERVGEDERGAVEIVVRGDAAERGGELPRGGGAVGAQVARDARREAHLRRAQRHGARHPLALRAPA